MSEFEGFRRWLIERAKGHREVEEQCTTSDGANLAADRALECEEIVTVIGDYWLGPLPTAQKKGPGVVAPEPTSPRKGSGPIEGPSPTKAT